MLRYATYVDPLDEGAYTGVLELQREPTFLFASSTVTGLDAALPFGA